MLCAEQSVTSSNRHSLNRQHLDFVTWETSTSKRQEFFAHNLAVLHSVNAYFRHLHSIVRILVRNIDIVLHHEAIVGNERSADFKAVHLHGVDPPICFPAHSLNAALLWRLTTHSRRFHAYNVLVIKRIDGFM